MLFLLEWQSRHGHAVRHRKEEEGTLTTAKAYWVATYRSVSNPDALAAYAKLSGPAITAAGGRILARGGYDGAGMIA